jgi:tRNA A37 threonylcarbamoyladenosine modification protein TsaB
MNTGSLFFKTENKVFNKILQSDKFKNDLLMQQIEDFFKENKLNIEEISKIFVNQGPGNFSGLRGSLAIAKGISISKNINLFGYNTFLWSCAKFFEKENSIYCLIKFRERYFLKKFNTYLKSSAEAFEVLVKDINDKYKNVFKVIPRNMIKDFEPTILKNNNINVVDLDHNDLESLQLNGLLEEKSIKPLYLN